MPYLFALANSQFTRIAMPAKLEHRRVPTLRTSEKNDFSAWSQAAGHGTTNFSSTKASNRILYLL